MKIISHPDTDQYPMDYPALVEGAKEFGVALELNNSSLRKPKSRLNCVENYRKMIPLCMERGVFVVVDTDAHDPSAVGNFELARKLLETMDINEDLLLNNDLQTDRNIHLVRNQKLPWRCFNVHEKDGEEHKHD